MNHERLPTHAGANKSCISFADIPIPVTLLRLTRNERHMKLEKLRTLCRVALKRKNGAPLAGAPPHRETYD